MSMFGKGEKEAFIPTPTLQATESWLSQTSCSSQMLLEKAAYMQLLKHFSFQSLIKELQQTLLQ